MQMYKLKYECYSIIQIYVCFYNNSSLILIFMYRFCLTDLEIKAENDL